MGIADNKATFSEIRRGIKKEINILRGIAVVAVVPILATVAKRVVLRI